jgi:hypothetical protein
VPDRWLSTIHGSRAVALHAIGAFPMLRSRIVTLFGSASRWLTLTRKSAAFAPGPDDVPPPPEPGPAV